MNQINQTLNLTMLHQHIQNSGPTVFALSATAGGAYYFYKKRAIGTSPASSKSSNPIHASTTGKEPDSSLSMISVNTISINWLKLGAQYNIGHKKLNLLQISKFELTSNEPAKTTQLDV